MYDTPTASLIAGVPGRASFGALKEATAVFDDYTKRTRKGLAKNVAAPFRVTATLCGDASQLSDDSMVDFVVGVIVAKAVQGTPSEFDSFDVRKALSLIGKRWLTLDAFLDAELQVEHAYEGWLVASGPKASARIVYDKPTSKKAMVSASAHEPGAFNAQQAAGETCFLIAN